MKRLVLLLTVLVALLSVVVGCGGSSNVSYTSEKSLALDLKTVQNAADDYYLRTMGKAPTFDGNLPAAGQFALINFNASYTEGGRTYSLMNLIDSLPRHYDEGVWHIDSQGKVSVDMAPQDY